MEGPTGAHGHVPREPQVCLASLCFGKGGLFWLSLQSVSCLPEYQRMFTQPTACKPSAELLGSLTSITVQQFLGNIAHMVARVQMVAL